MALANTAKSAALALSNLAGESSARAAKQARTAQAAKTPEQRPPAHHAGRGPSPVDSGAGVHGTTMGGGHGDFLEGPHSYNNDILPARQRSFFRLPWR
jgi:hypothetical protein